jgi:hypothetical protein
MNHFLRQHRRDEEVSEGLAINTLKGRQCEQNGLKMSSE